MKARKYIILIILLICHLLPTFPQQSTENYLQITERVSDSKTKSTVQYYDGLGRQKEVVELGITPQGSNLVRLRQYDGLGRELRTWLPVVGNADYISNVSSFAESQYGDSKPYTETSYDGSPLDRAIKVQGEGEKWANHASQTDYLVNTSSYPLNCKYYRVSMQGALQDKGYYPEGRLHVTKITDEDGHESYEFSNQSGNVVLRRIVLSSTESADTYYIYDYRGNLSYVLPPNYQDNADLSLYAYQYKYDGRGNCTWKKLPGCEPVSMVYDKAHQLVFLQDGNLRKQGLWKFFVSDQLGRLVVTGLSSTTENVSDSHVYARYTGLGSLDGYQLYGASISPRSYLVTNFYDDYAFISQSDASLQSNLRINVGNSLESTFPSNSAPNAKGYLTGKKVYLTDGSGKYLLSALYYGKKGRVVQSHSSNALGGWEHVYTSYMYNGSPQQTKHVHTTDGKRSVQESYTYEYDHVGRLTKTRYSIDGGTERVLSSMTYDNYGRLSAQTFLGRETVSHTYNLRSWPSTIAGQNFKQRLAYQSLNGNLYTMKSCYNGNVASTSWQVGNQTERAFFFFYNNQNMLTRANYGEGEHLSDARNQYTETFSYDKVGNILSLQRDGLLDDSEYGSLDNLSYTYNGNQLEKVDDTVKGPYYAGAFHFVDGVNEDVEYSYDANENMTKDANKGITEIQYDVNDCPRKIIFSDGRKAEYLYDADGNKLSVLYNLTAMTSTLPQMPVMQSPNVISANSVNGQKAISYCGNVIYDDNDTYVLNDVGYALYDQMGNLSFHYYLQDHLGNNRVVMNESGEMEQVNDYYPSGALMGSSTGGAVQRYKYNGKELDRLNGLDWYDYGARNYDAAIVRWNSMDKLAEKYYSYTPYGYCENNYINATDLDGNSSKKSLLKGFLKVGKQVWKNGLSALLNAQTYEDAFSDISTETKTVFDDKASTKDRFVAGFQIVGDFLTITEESGKSGGSFKNAISRKGAFRQAKRDAHIAIGEQPIAIKKVQMKGKNRKTILGKNGKPIITREYTYKNDKGQKIIIQDHSAGHSYFKGDASEPHFNVRPADNTRHGNVFGTKQHYKFKR